MTARDWLVNREGNVEVFRLLHRVYDRNTILNSMYLDLGVFAK